MEGRLSALILYGIQITFAWRPKIEGSTDRTAEDRSNYREEINTRSLKSSGAQKPLKAMERTIEMISNDKIPEEIVTMVDSLGKLVQKASATNA